jgi:hypothetical protein
MKKIYDTIACIAVTWLLSACNDNGQMKKSQAPDDRPAKGTYAYDLEVMKKNASQVIELTDSSGQSKVLLCGDFQGRVMTSTAAGDSGSSFGWINYELVSSRQKKQNFNPYGGEERFWMGPEGGQYSLYFKKGDSFNLNHWQVPAIIDTVEYQLLHSNRTQAEFFKQATIANYAGTVFDIRITRKISLLDKSAIEQRISAKLPTGIRYVGFESTNQILNQGNQGWKKEKGLLSIWLLGMMTPTNATKVIIPFHGGQKARSYITDDYFGIIPPDRLKVKDSVLFFRCDGAFRSKIGISPVIAKPMAASFDFDRNILTLILPEVHRNGMYVNSKWEIQKQPFAGDVINSYNDGPLASGGQLGPFYEVESSCPALELAPGDVEQYRQTTCHFQGDYASLRALALQLLKVDLDEVKKW